MKVVLLCGGVGKRMFPITEDKFLLNFVGKTLLEHHIELARKAGLADFVIVAGPQNMARIEAVIVGIPGIRVSLALQEEPLGIAHALESARRFLDGEIIVVNPNDVFDLSAYTGLLEDGRNGSALTSLLGRRVDGYFPGGYLVVDEKGRLERIMEKPGRGEEPSDLVNIMLHRHREPGTLLKYAAGIQTSRDDVYERAIDAMAKDTGRVSVIPYDGWWDAIKFPWHIHAVARQFLAERERYISPSAEVSERATISGPVVIDDRVRVMEGAVIRGPAYIGANTVIGTGALVRDYSHIGADCVVGYGTEVKGSYIGDGCWFHMNYIGDSIIGDGCSFGAGTVLANWRFDEGSISVEVEGESIDTGRDKFGAIIGSNARTGVNVSIMPGVRVGQGSIVGPHLCLREDLEPDTVVLAEGGYRTVKSARLAREEESRLARR